MRKIALVLLLFVALAGFTAGCNMGPGNPSQTGAANPGVAPVGGGAAPAPAPAPS